MLKATLITKLEPGKAAKIDPTTIEWSTDMSQPVPFVQVVNNPKKLSCDRGGVFGLSRTPSTELGVFIAARSQGHSLVVCRNWTSGGRNRLHVANPVFLLHFQDCRPAKSVVAVSKAIGYTPIRSGCPGIEF